jgi:hypothetical protein
VIFFLLLFSSLTLPISAFHLSILSIMLFKIHTDIYRYTINMRYYVIWCTINTFMGCAETERWSMIQSGFLFWTLCPGNLDLVSPVPFSINYTYSGMLDMSVISLLNFG